jgi:hypothetical protein
MNKEERALIKELVLPTRSLERLDTAPVNFQMMRELNKLIILSPQNHDWG